MNRWRAPQVDDAARRARFEAVFREVYEPLQRYALRRTDPASADDVVAEALTVVWRRLDDVPAEMVLPWCYGVARRCLANQRRTDRRRDALVDRMAADVGSAAVDWANGIDGELDAALAQLSTDDRELVRLWAWEGLQPREIAEVFGTTPNAVSIRLHRAKAHLSRELGKDRSPSGHIVGGDAEEAP